ncbi:hypothetical protein AJ79_00235 [Helicocarpus griseus UAMH5409]|uniref:ARS binding protein Abp2 n=1 Tax=Helicocarpus griseus UAMH5409 TaxID=1447875 RepID=A0A2B7YD77_9EURO|nr:hypothetical protein AJ79_00235 [Helicocarpus griseus UAMH5409]
MDSYPNMGGQADAAQHGLANGGLIQQYAKYPPANEPGLQNSSPSGGSQNNRLDHTMSPPISRRDISRNVQPSPRDSRSGVLRTPDSHSAASMSPAFSVLSQNRHREGRMAAETRYLPSPDVTDATIDDAYVAFIFYCNPSVPSGTDTSELRRIFRTPPRSEGKSFSIFTLWQLIQKLDRKELKTWIQLAIELGVEPPSMEKKQSTQKVQQYAVRLKRWMRAMHVDAFFEYCLGHNHVYYTQFNPSTEPTMESRDGVPREEDLALRALFPEWKPKKGRKRAEPRDSDDPKAPKRPHLDIPAVEMESNELSYNPETFAQSAIPNSAIPWSAFPDDLEQHDPFAPHSAIAVPNNAENQLNQHQMVSREFDSRWRVPGREISPAIQYPQSAITPRYRDSDTPNPIEPRSAITPSSDDKAQTKRRRGPAVSSAWSGAGNPSNGTKFRGRPGGNRTTQNGPFSTFSVQLKDKGPNTSPGHAEQAQFGLINKDGTNGTHTQTNSSGLAPPFQPLNNKPARLQLQVPQNQGAPVRLATPPTVLVNGEKGNSSSTNEHGRQQPSEVGSSQQVTRNQASQYRYNQASEVEFTIDDVAHAFSLQIHQGKLVNRDMPLSLGESRTIADVVIKRIKLICAPGLPSNVVAVYCAACLGVGYRLGLGGYPPGQLTVKACPDNIGYKQQGAASTPGSSSIGNESASTMPYSLSYDLNPATGLSVHATIPGREAQETPGAHTRADRIVEDYCSEDDVMDEHASEAVWKQRYLNLRKQSRKKDLALSKYRKKILEAVMADV